MNVWIEKPKLKKSKKYQYCICILNNATKIAIKISHVFDIKFFSATDERRSFSQMIIMVMDYGLPYKTELLLYNC